MIAAALLGLVHARMVPFDRIEGRAKHALLDGHGTVCHVPSTQVADSPFTHAIWPEVQGSVVLRA